jgi:hypothetical protein
MYRGPIHIRPILKISGLIFVASAGGYSWGRQGTQEQGRLQLQPEKNNNTGKMAVITPFQVSQPQLGSYWGMSFLHTLPCKTPLLFHTPLDAFPCPLARPREKTTEHGLMKPEPDPLRRADDL